MKYLILAAFAAFALAAVGCTTEKTVVVEVTPEPAAQYEEDWEQVIYEDWVDGWTEDGTSIREANCIWEVMMNYYGSPGGYIAAVIGSDDTDDAVDDFFDDNVTELVKCWDD